MPDFTPRPTVYKGIKMRSRLEAGYAQWLDLWGFRWTYEPQAFAGSGGQYLPDFRLDDVPYLSGGEVRPTRCYVEVKPDVPLDLEALRLRMRIIEESERYGAQLLLARPGQPLLLAAHETWLQMTWIYDVTPGEPWTEYLILGMNCGPEPWPHGYWKGPAD